MLARCPERDFSILIPHSVFGIGFCVYSPSQPGLATFQVPSSDMWPLSCAVRIWPLMFSPTLCPPSSPFYTLQLPPRVQWSVGLGVGLGRKGWPGQGQIKNTIWDQVKKALNGRLRNLVVMVLRSANVLLALSPQGLTRAASCNVREELFLGGHQSRGLRGCQSQVSWLRKAGVATDE